MVLGCLFTIVGLKEIMLTVFVAFEKGHKNEPFWTRNLDILKGTMGSANQIELCGQSYQLQVLTPDMLRKHNKSFALVES